MGGEGGEEPVWAGAALSWGDMGWRRLFPMEMSSFPSAELPDLCCILLLFFFFLRRGKDNFEIERNKKLLQIRLLENCSYYSVTQVESSAVRTRTTLPDSQSVMLFSKPWLVLHASVRLDTSCQSHLIEFHFVHPAISRTSEVSW